MGKVIAPTRIAERWAASASTHCAFHKSFLSLDNDQEPRTTWSESTIEDRRESQVFYY